jgi:hypothetical protein
MADLMTADGKRKIEPVRNPRTGKVYALGEEGGCPVCDQPARPWTVEGYDEGYFEACVACAPQVALDMLRDVGFDEDAGAPPSA